MGSTTRTYDTTGRSDLLRHDDAVGALLASYDYDYDFGGLLIHEERDHQDSQYAQSIDYQYDLTGQLTDAFFSGQDDEHYQYDANGNRVFSKVDDDEQTYTTGTANQLLSDGMYRYEYDGEGNQVERVSLPTGEVRMFEYNYRNQLVRVDDWSTDPDASPNAAINQTVLFRYDAFGRRTARGLDDDGDDSDPSDTTHFLLDRQNVWADVDDSGNNVAKFLFGDRLDQVLGRTAASDGQVWYHPDQLGSVRTIMHSQASSFTQSEFSTFGVLASEHAAEQFDRFKFAARELDPSLNTYFNRARQFDPVAGRFSTEDPLRFEAGDVNLSRYVNNSPLNGTDPTGEKIVTRALLLSALVGGAVTAVASAKADLACQVANGDDFNSESFVESTVNGLVVGALGGAFLGLVSVQGTISAGTLSALGFELAVPPLSYVVCKVV